MNKAKINHFYLIITVIFIGFTNQVAQAQDFRLGFKANPLFSNLKPSSDFNNSAATKVGFSYGLIFDYFLKEHYAIETEFGISTMGGKVEYSKSDTTISSDIKMNYIEIPISVKLLTAEVRENLKVYGKFGLNLGFSTKSSAEVVYKKGANQYAKDDIKNASKYIQPFNASLIIGAGVEYNVAKNLDLMLGLTYANGFLNTMKSNSLYRLDNTNPNVKAFDADLNYFAINVGLLF